jgi:FixJ family two-component response regulator
VVFDLKRELAETIISMQIPIISITAHGDVPMAVRAMKAGAVEFLTEPFPHQDLRDAIQQTLKRDRIRGSNLLTLVKLRCKGRYIGTKRIVDLAGIPVYL